MSDYYKSLISDDEVIKELIKESKRREGKLPTEVSRLKPNLNFFQRTVTNLVSNNSRIDKCQDTFKRNGNANNLRTPLLYKYSLAKKPLIDYEFERQLILQTKSKFVKSRGEEPKDVAEIIKGNGHNYYKPDIRKIIDELSTESDDSETNDSPEISNNLKERTTCISTSYRNYRSNKRKCFKPGNSDDVIFISSDDSDEERINESKSKMVKTRVIIKESGSEEERTHKTIKNKHKMKKQMPDVK